MSPDEPLRVVIAGRAWDVEGPAQADELHRAGARSGLLRTSRGPRAVAWGPPSGSGPGGGPGAGDRAGDGSGADAALEVVVDGWRFEVTVEPLARARLRERARRGAASVAAHGPLLVRAPIPGRIGAVRVHEGQAVDAGAPLLTLEAMKMENVVRAPRAGTIGRITAAAGRTVELGDPLLELA